MAQFPEGTQLQAGIQTSQNVSIIRLVNIVIPTYIAVSFWFLCP